MATTTEDRLLTLADVKARLGISRTMIYRLMGQGRFPKPLKLGDRSNRWLESEIEDWLLSRERANINE